MPPRMAMMTLDASDRSHAAAITACSQLERSLPPMASTTISAMPGRSRTVAERNLFIFLFLPRDAREAEQDQRRDCPRHDHRPPVQRKTSLLLLLFHDILPGRGLFSQFRPPSTEA